MKLLFNNKSLKLLILKTMKLFTYVIALFAIIATVLSFEFDAPGKKAAKKAAAKKAAKAAAKKGGKAAAKKGGKAAAKKGGKAAAKKGGKAAKKAHKRRPMMSIA